MKVFSGTDRIFSLKRGRITFLFQQPILRQMAQEIAFSLPQELPLRHKRVIVFSGVHRNFGWLLLRPGFKIGLQTEQLVDQNGKPLWGQNKPGLEKNLKRALRHLDVLLDINPSNIIYYDQLDLSTKDRLKLHFGPHIFPKSRVDLDAAGHEHFIFFGEVGSRRKTVLKGLGNLPIRVVPYGTFGKALYREIKQSRGVLNIHFEKGIYTEAPRLLSAYLKGKPVLSERLAEPFVAGQHYLSLSENPGHDRLEESFRAFSELVAGSYAFEDFLTRIGA